MYLNRKIVSYIINEAVMMRINENEENTLLRKDIRSEDIPWWIGGPAVPRRRKESAGKDRAGAKK